MKIMESSEMRVLFFVLVGDAKIHRKDSALPENPGRIDNFFQKIEIKRLFRYFVQEIWGSNKFLGQNSKKKSLNFNLFLN